MHSSLPSFDSWTDSQLRIGDLRRAWDSRDPDLAELIVRMVGGQDPTLETPVREGALTLARFTAQLRAPEFRKKNREEKAHFRTETLKALTAPDAEVPLPDRFKVDALLLELWAANGPYERHVLATVIASIPLRWGPWRALKQLYKASIETGDNELFGLLAARFDEAYAAGRTHLEVTRKTLAYLVRRGWRHLREQAETLPATYPDLACAVLCQYSDDTRWNGTWIANHIFYHETGKYTRRRFTYGWRRPKSLLEHRAFAALWRRTPRPLFSLLERAKSTQAQRFATESLTTDFRTSLREVEPSWVARLISVGSEAIDEFAIWILANVPRFEQAAFVELGLHDAVLSLLRSDSDKAQEYAASYARTHARDLPLDTLIELANSENTAVRRLARDLLRERDPRKDVGLDGWGQLLGTEYGHELAAEALRKHFSAKELTLDWFKERLLSDNDDTFTFASEHLGRIHKAASVPLSFYVSLIDDPRFHSDCAELVSEELVRCLADLDADLVKRAMVHPLLRDSFIDWFDQGRLAFDLIGVDHLKLVAFHPEWAEHPWVKALEHAYPWAKDLDFSDELRDKALAWLNDIRNFSPEQLGFNWLMKLVQRSEPEYFDFASEYMIKAFLPADFAESAGAAHAAEPEPSGEINVDLGGMSFLFTGKLMSMTRSEAEGKVTTAKGTNAAGVSVKLDYLVIGDDGSPLYGAGRKGSTQLKAEKLISDGAPMRIISETAFLQMLAGEQREFSEESVTEGCLRLWERASGPEAGESSLSRFALRYLRRHHMDIGLAMSDRPVDPGAEIPDEFLTFERVAPLFADSRPLMRSFALQLAHWEFARWKPPIASIVELAEIPYDEVRNFVTEALLADERPVHKRYRVDPNTLTAEAVYSFCESLDKSTRDLGMKLIARDPRLAIPEELFRLTESPDRQVRAFVIQNLWSLYRDRGITLHWKPAQPPEEPTKKKKGKKGEAEAKVVGGAPPRPEALPANPVALRDFFRRVLFGIPPAKLPKRPAGAGPRLKPLPARRAKLASVEVFRDVACGDAEIAKLIAPLLEEFMGSRGLSERQACMVALLRIAKAHPELEVWKAV